MDRALPMALSGALLQKGPASTEWAKACTFVCDSLQAATLFEHLIEYDHGKEPLTIGEMDETVGLFGYLRLVNMTQWRQYFDVHKR